jgi:hypothetical protein
MIPIALLFAIQSANLPNATLHAPNLKTPFATLNAKNPNVKSNVPIKDAKCSIAPSALLFANNLIASLIAKLPSPNVNLFAKNPNATGNVTSPIAPNQSANLYAKIPIAFLKLNAALALSELLELLNLSPSSKKLKSKINAANARNKW